MTEIQTLELDETGEVRPVPLGAASCSHANRRRIGVTQEGAGTVIVEWCPDCGALKRTMTNWRYTDYPWEMPSRVNSELNKTGPFNSK